MNTIDRLQVIFRDVFDEDDLILTPETNAEDIEDWDSLANINLIVAIEKDYQLKFDLADIQRLENVGQMVELVDRLRSQQSTEQSL